MNSLYMVYTYVFIFSRVLISLELCFEYILDTCFQAIVCVVQPLSSEAVEVRASTEEAISVYGIETFLL